MSGYTLAVLIGAVAGILVGLLGRWLTNERRWP